MQRSPPSWRSPIAWATLLAVAFAALALDLLTKEVAFRTVAGQPVQLDADLVRQSRDLSRLVPPHEPIRLVPGVLHLTLVLNRGAVFGVGQGHQGFFIAFTIAAFAFGVWVFLFWTRAGDIMAHAGIGLLLGGGLGNLYDRLAFACVRDFLHPLPGLILPFGWRVPFTGSRELWPYVSNVADLLLLIGIAAIMTHVWRGGRPTGAAAHQASA